MILKVCEKQRANEVSVEIKLFFKKKIKSLYSLNQQYVDQQILSEVREKVRRGGNATGLVQNHYQMD